MSLCRRFPEVMPRPLSVIARSLRSPRRPSLVLPRLHAREGQARRASVVIRLPMNEVPATNLTKTHTVDLVDSVAVAPLPWCLIHLLRDKVSSPSLLISPRGLRWTLALNSHSRKLFIYRHRAPHWKMANNLQHEAHPSHTGKLIHGENLNNERQNS